MSNFAIWMHGFLVIICIFPHIIIYWYVFIVSDDFEDVPIVTDVEVIPIREHITSKVTTTAPISLTIPCGSDVVPNPNSTVAGSNINTTTTVTKGASRRIPLHKNLGRNSAGLQCQHCGKETVTYVKDMIGLTTIIAVIALALLFWPLCWVPFCVPSCKRTHHHCGHDGCRKMVGVTHSCA